MSGPKLTGNRCQCPACGEYFGSVRGFDRHRVGEYRPGGRRCLSVAELRGLGWAMDGRGFLLTPDPRRAGAALQRDISTLPATRVALTHGRAQDGEISP